MEKLLQQDTLVGAFLFQLHPEIIEKPSDSLSLIQKHELQILLQDYEGVFSTPKSLPPHRLHDHKIPFLEGSKPPSMRPYRYGPLQKNEIEKCVQELLAFGFIRVSNNSYSSPFILVKKKEGT